MGAKMEGKETGGGGGYILGRPPPHTTLDKEVKCFGVCKTTLGVGLDCQNFDPVGRSGRIGDSGRIGGGRAVFTLRKTTQ